MTLNDFFAQNPKVAVAFSGGVDSSYLLYAAQKAGAQVRAYYAKTAFQPEFEYQDALRLAELLKADLKTLHLDVLACDKVTENPKNRCYFCKQQIFGNICAEAKQDGFTVILDGTNASDDAGDRPGMRALEEMQVLSPLRLCGLTKAEIRRLSKEAGLFTWNKPAYACLATRIPTGMEITAENLARTERAEDSLMKLGFSDFRVRTQGTAAKLQLTEQQLPLALQKRREILEILKPAYSDVWLDLEARHES